MVAKNIANMCIQMRVTAPPYTFDTGYYRDYGLLSLMKMYDFIQAQN